MTRTTAKGRMRGHAQCRTRELRGRDCEATRQGACAGARVPAFESTRARVEARARSVARTHARAQAKARTVTIFRNVLTINAIPCGGACGECPSVLTETIASQTGTWCNTFGKKAQDRYELPGLSRGNLRPVK
eukprot:1103627-Pleurochrysis_carterae.AAC.2